MTAEEFALRHPKPWHFAVNETSFSLNDANGTAIGWLYLKNKHSGVSQAEWNRHLAVGLKTPEIDVIPAQ